MKIPEEAIKAAARAIASAVPENGEWEYVDPDERSWYVRDAHIALEAAKNLMYAQALRDEASLRVFRAKESGDPRIIQYESEEAARLVSRSIELGFS